MNRVDVILDSLQSKPNGWRQVLFSVADSFTGKWRLGCIWLENERFCLWL